MPRLPAPPLALLALGLAGACAPASEPGATPDGWSSEGAMLSLDVLGNTDVVGYHFELSRVACAPGEDVSPWSESWNVDLVDGYFPAMVTMVEERFDADSVHVGADLFVPLDPGCYEVQAWPAQEVDAESWVPSDDCTPTGAETAEVVAGETAEVLLVSQCNGDGPDAP